MIVKEFKDGNHLYCGHFSLKESSKNYDAKLSKEDLKDYLYVFLGHIHSYELIKPNIVHLGSSRYVSFDEAEDKQKIVALITDYGMETEKVHFMKLKSPIPMIQLELSKNDQKQTIADDLLAKKVDSTSSDKANSPSFNSISAISSYLDKIDPKTKVKVKILDFESFRQFLPLVNRYDNKFSLFKYETDFIVISANNQKVGLTETTNFKESFTKWLSQQNVDLKIKEILKKEIENA
jgi:DNA repair exonuclease SbcCD nuclease subunit